MHYRRPVLQVYRTPYNAVLYPSCKVNIFMATSLLQRTTICAYDISQVSVGSGRVCQLDFSRIVVTAGYRGVYSKIHLIIISSYIAGYYHISWKTSLKS